MRQGQVGIGAVVRETLGGEGIVLSRQDVPVQKWIEGQIDAADIMKLGPEVQWWGVMPFSGGFLLCPEPMLIWLRDASYEDFLAVADHAGVDGRLKLAKALPRYVDLLLKNRGQKT